MNMSQFYITLPSDSSMNVFPNNTVAHYTTKLAQRIHLDGDYEVALTECIYPKNWVNFKGDMSMRIMKASAKTGCELVTFKNGYFENIRDLLKYMNGENEKADNSQVGLEYDEVTRKISLLTVQPSGMIMSDALQNYLGFLQKGPYERGIYEAENTFDLNAGVHLMYIYSDIASFSLVGDTQTPLLRVCSTSGTNGDKRRVTFTNPQYMPVAYRDFETIEININNELGEPMPFMQGKSVCTLHFRRINTLSVR